MKNDYRFLEDEKDWIISIIQTEAQDQLGELKGAVIDKLAYDAGISPGTLRSWFFGDTRRPQHATVRMVLAALECRVKIVRRDGTEIRGSQHVAKETSQKVRTKTRKQGTHDRERPTA